MKIKFIVEVVKWRSKKDNNAYHSVRITRTLDGAVIVGTFPPYEYGDGYKDTALSSMAHHGWIPEKYCGRHTNWMPRYLEYERLEGNPIKWVIKNGRKKEMIENGTLKVER